MKKRFKVHKRLSRRSYSSLDSSVFSKFDVLGSYTGSSIADDLHPEQDADDL